MRSLFYSVLAGIGIVMGISGGSALAAVGDPCGMNGVCTLSTSCPIDNQLPAAICGDGAICCSSSAATAVPSAAAPTAPSDTSTSASTGNWWDSVFTGNQRNDPAPCPDALYPCTSSSTTSATGGMTATGGTGGSTATQQSVGSTPLFVGLQPLTQVSGTCPPGTQLEGGVCIPYNTGLARGDATGRFGRVLSFPALCLAGPIICVLSTFMNWLLALLGIVAIISFVIAGLQYILAFGEPKDIEKAKAHIKWAIMGLVVALSGLIIILSVDMFLRGY